MDSLDALKPVATALKQQDYPLALQYLKGFLATSPDHPWGLFYWGQLQEAQHQLRGAEDTYRRVLKATEQPKLISLARQGILRVQAQEQSEWQEAIVAATVEPEQTQLGCLVLEPMDTQHRQAVAAEFGRLMHLDAYTARLHLPSRIWRLYRTGAIGELQLYEQELRRLEIPAFCITLKTIQQIPTYRVRSLTCTPQHMTLEGQDHHHESIVLPIPWNRVTAWVEGLLPILEQVVDQGAWRKVVRKEKTQDYGHCVDLHLRDPLAIVRICDRSYQLPPLPHDHLPLSTHRQRWTTFLDELAQPLAAVPRRSSFNHFAEAALDQDMFLLKIAPQTDLMRSEPNPWDSAFHLYSILHLLHPGLTQD